MHAKGVLALAASLAAFGAHADMHGAKHSDMDAKIVEQRANLAKNTESAGSGPRPPRDLRTQPTVLKMQVAEIG